MGFKVAVSIIILLSNSIAIFTHFTSLSLKLMNKEMLHRKYRNGSSSSNFYYDQDFVTLMTHIYS